MQIKKLAYLENPMNKKIFKSIHDIFVYIYKYLCRHNVYFPARTQSCHGHQ